MSFYYVEAVYIYVDCRIMHFDTELVVFVKGRKFIKISRGGAKFVPDILNKLFMI